MDSSKGNPGEVQEAERNRDAPRVVEAVKEVALNPKTGHLTRQALGECFQSLATVQGPWGGGRPNRSEEPSEAW